MAFCAIAMGVSVVGCANPGPPQPPTLKLPQVVAADTLTAVRVGNEVRLHWTTPTHTTDKLLIKGGVTAVLCREVVADAGKAGGAKAAVAKPGAECAAVGRVAVTPGPSDAVDALPAELASGPVRLLAYRVELLNAAGRTAGPSAAVVAAAGEAEPALANFHGRMDQAGVVLEWEKLPAAAEASTVELTRTTVAAPQKAAVAANPALPVVDAPEKVKQPPTAKLVAGNVDAGGVVDRTAQIGFTYRYTAERVRTVDVGGKTVEVRSAPTQALEFAVRDVFPPSVPTGLVAVPAYAGKVPAIDLSWDPDVEARVAGYRVYRREGTGAWQRLTAELVTTAAYRDTAVLAGRTYTYRVTAVSTAGNESAAGGDVGETAPVGQ